jgi:hypothetical protein
MLKGSWWLSEPRLSTVVLVDNVWFRDVVWRSSTFISLGFPFSLLFRVHGNRICVTCKRPPSCLSVILQKLRFFKVLRDLGSNLSCVSHPSSHPAKISMSFVHPPVNRKEFCFAVAARQSAGRSCCALLCYVVLSLTVVGSFHCGVFSLFPACLCVVFGWA